jgi:uncharacterized C2H2 Zn-finger protein
MALSKCPKCDNHFFEMKEAEPTNSAYKVNFLQCSRCGAVVGVMDYFSVGTLIRKLIKALGFDPDRL